MTRDLDLAGHRVDRYGWSDASCAKRTAALGLLGLGQPHAVLEHGRRGGSGEELLGELPQRKSLHREAARQAIERTRLSAQPALDAPQRAELGRSTLRRECLERRRERAQDEGIEE